MGERERRNPSKHHYPKLPHIQVPSSEWDSFLMKGLNPGQKRYFYSILSIYDSRGQREALCRCYTISLQRHNALGLITKQQVRYYASFIKDSKSSRRSKPRRRSPTKADGRRAKLHSCNQI
ncbi:protein FAM216B [Ahaetulla prasina]|uniref:protein FAM216B n=1 Tax=Ahaetulla prasina TaxID=499056 RepID=UPI00264793C0|nr:protein FAM216B [Ahaetulla prasina]XP_058040704.1 protein FAM216B [Ahaetulla prasina]